MSAGYESMDNDELQTLFDVTRKNHSQLKLQEARFGSLYVPPYVVSQIRDLEVQLQAIKRELEQRQSSAPSPSSPIQQVDNVIASSAQPQVVDVVIITALEEERRAVLAHFPVSKRFMAADGINVYYQTSMTSQDDSSKTYHVIVLQLLAMGRLNAAHATNDAIRRWNPKSVLLIGIAGGIGGKDVRIGDVLVSDQVVDYELQKITSEGPEVRYEVYRVAPRWQSIARALDDYEWMPLIRVDRPDDKSPRRHIGPIATGDKVIAFDDILRRYQQAWPRLIGVEMEAGGVASAAFNQAEAPGFFMVRGVSDLANQDKNKPRVKGWREYACAVAAAYAVGMIKSGLLPAASA
jgi:nucleoside phosphorylase